MSETNQGSPSFATGCSHGGDKPLCSEAENAARSHDRAYYVLIPCVNVYDAKILKRLIAEDYGAESDVVTADDRQSAAPEASSLAVTPITDGR